MSTWNITGTNAPQPKAESGALFSFSFPIKGDVHYVTRSRSKAITAKKMRATFKIVTTGGFVSKDGGATPAIRLYIQKHGDDWSGVGQFETYRQWSRPLALANGLFVLEANLVQEEWTNVQGKYGGLKDALANPKAMGVTFGSKELSAGHGVRATKPNKFTMIRFALDMNVPSFVKPRNEEASADKLDKVREKIIALRDQELFAKDLEEQLSNLKKAIHKGYHIELPDLMDEAGVDRIGVPASGNMPAMDATLNPFYSANIAASWPAEKRAAAFKWLADNGHEDIIKQEFSVPIARGDDTSAREIADWLHIAGYSYVKKENVHASTLTAWVREQVESGGVLPPLETIGAFIGRVVKLKPRKE